MKPSSFWLARYFDVLETNMQKELVQHLKKENQLVHQPYHTSGCLLFLESHPPKVADLGSDFDLVRLQNTLA